ncbi:hypothetical protein GOBAR_AA31158 [Gossypium barbadense]|uniref:Vacuolar protein sorting-associated protein 55 homolog n=1 Tax=Gossypium barbadense TaxID=3634 RepID=A0A2P5WEL0_GOSBA|nr:hypothetical protein GOBAR_AA31158 [Gossypium barbadense]
MAMTIEGCLALCEDGIYGPSGVLLLPDVEWVYCSTMPPVSRLHIATLSAETSDIYQYATACALYNNWWPMLSALMYVLVPMPCLFFGGGSTQFLTSRDGGGWIDAAKFLTGASAIGSFAIPIILRHAHMISTGAMFIEFTSFIIFVCTVLCFHRASLEDDW